MGKLIAVFMNALRKLFGSRMGTWVASAMAWLGLSFGSYQIAIDPMLDAIRAHMQSGGGGEYGSVAVAYMGVMKFDVAVSMAISYVAIRQGVASAKLFLTKRTA